MKKKPTPIEKFLALTDAQKEAEWAKLDREIPFAESRPLTAAQRGQWTRMQKQLKAGRPKVGEGAKIVPVSIERGLLREADAFAKRHKLKRSELVARGLRLAMQRHAG
jgi:hypothetical protein